jgi:hypothetical protein
MNRKRGEGVGKAKKDGKRKEGNGKRKEGNVKGEKGIEKDRREHQRTEGKDK